MIIKTKEETHFYAVTFSHAVTFSDDRSDSGWLVCQYAFQLVAQVQNQLYQHHFPFLAGKYVLFCFSELSYGVWQRPKHTILFISVHDIPIAINKTQISSCCQKSFYSFTKSLEDDLFFHKFNMINSQKVRTKTSHRGKKSSCHFQIVLLFGHLHQLSLKPIVQMRWVFSWAIQSYRWFYFAFSLVSWH